MAAIGCNGSSREWLVEGSLDVTNQSYSPGLLWFTLKELIAIQEKAAAEGARGVHRARRTCASRVRLHAKWLQGSGATIVCRRPRPLRT